MTTTKERNGNPANWRELRETLGESFTARVRGVVKRDLRLLDVNGAQAGRLRLRGLDGAELRAGALEARIERSGPGYRMLSAGETVFETTDPLSENMSLARGGETYEVRASPLRNAASARSSSGDVSRIKGDLLGRRYEVSLESKDEYALPVAAFLLYLTVSLRSRAWYKKS